jgi:hypothetical protein
VFMTITLKILAIYGLQCLLLLGDAHLFLVWLDDHNYLLSAFKLLLHVPVMIVCVWCFDENDEKRVMTHLIGCGSLHLAGDLNYEPPSMEQCHLGYVYTGISIQEELNAQ